MKARKTDSEKSNPQEKNALSGDFLFSSLVLRTSTMLYPLNRVYECSFFMKQKREYRFTGAFYLSDNRVVVASLDEETAHTSAEAVL